MDYFNDIFNLIAHNEIFRELPHSAIRELCSSMKPEHFPKDTVILKKNTIGNWMYIIKKGRVKVHDESHTITFLEAGEIIGELSLLKSEVRSMTVTTMEDTYTYSIAHDDFFSIAERHPKVLRGIIGVLVDRLRNQTSETLRAYEIREKELSLLVEERTQDLHHKNKELERTQKYKEQFLANMSHEIRTPMTAIVGLTNLVLEETINDRQRNYLNSVQQATHVLLNIINEILDYSKIEAGKMSLEKRYFSIQDVVDQVVVTLKQKALEKGILLYSNIHSHIPKVVIGDALRLNQILVNLVGNAIKFTEKGSVAIEISLSKTKTILFSVVDTGIGIPEDKITEIFKGFTQAYTSDSRKHGGSGLGLTISKRLVELMGGALKVESILGSGSKFFFELSLPIGTPEQLLQQNKPQQIDITQLNGLKILLVDDNEINRMVCKDTLISKAQVRITEAINGLDAIERLKAGDFDIILMDVQMPEMDGCEATEVIRKKFTAPKKDIPIIAITASVIRSDLDKCREAGMNDYIPKPFQPDQLIGTILKNIEWKIDAIPLEKSHPTTNNIVESTSPILNNESVQLDYLKDFCAGNKEKMLKYMNMYLDTLPAFIENLNTALTQKNFEEIATQTHGFKLKFVMMGMQEAKDLGLSLELECRNNKPDIDIITKKTNTLIKLIVTSSTELSKIKETFTTQ